MPSGDTDHGHGGTVISELVIRDGRWMVSGRDDGEAKVMGE